MHFTVHAWTLLFQTVNFLVLAWLLQRLLYKPALKVMARRRDETARVLSDAEKAREEAQAALAAVDNERAAMEQKFSVTVRERDAEAEKVRTEMLDRARREAETYAANERKRLDEERDATLRELRDLAGDLAVRLASALLRDARPDGVAGAFLDRAVRHIEQLPAAQLKDLREQVASERLRVVTAPPLDETSQGVWRGRLQRVTGCAGVEFVSNDGLLGGVELVFPKSILRFHWQDALALAQRELTHHADAA